MTGQLRSCLLGLVVLNLVFVQITGSVSLTWMLPLFALTIAAPMLIRFQNLLSYRAAWNAALLAIFALLIKDVKDSGIRYMLEDGLILAAFCQVHVLNNLAKQKRPDLIFFNSFLIALVTSFFCQDLMYSVVFFIYAAVLIFGLSISSAGTRDRFPTRVLQHEELRALLGRSQKMVFLTLLFTGLAFTLWPRDFDREGFVETQMAEASSVAQVGFSDEIRFDNKGNVTKTNRIVMRAKLTKGSREAVSEYWRGATFTNLQKRGWWADTNPQNSGYRTTRQLDESWRRKNAHEFHRPGHRTGSSMEVSLAVARPQSLFMPFEANRIQFQCTAWPLLDGNFRITGVHNDKIRYSIDLNHVDEPRKVGMPGFLGEHRRLRAGAVPRGIERLHRDIGRGLGRNPAPDLVIDRIRNYLAEHRVYYLPGESGAAENLHAFIDGEGGGHCEYFATTMIILLRKRQIPCRMVSGYLAHEWNEAGTELIIRSNHAHAWVEVWDPDKGWITVDPTPPRSDGSDESVFTETRDYLRNLWSNVTRFDAKGRDSALQWMGTQLTTLGHTIARHPVWFTGGLLALFALRYWWRSRRRHRPPPPVVDYLAVLRRLGLERRTGETPRQLLERAQSEGLAAERLEQLASATDAHEQARYA